MTVNLVAQFNEFLREQSKNGGSVDSLQKLKTDAGITLTLTTTDDPDGVGTFVQYRAAWYVAGDAAGLANFFMLFDARWRTNI